VPGVSNRTSDRSVRGGLSEWRFEGPPGTPTRRMAASLLRDRSHAVDDPTTDQGWEHFEHTADVGLRASGRDLEELLQHAADGFIELMIHPETVAETRSVKVSCTGEDPEELLVTWLEEILYFFEVERLAPSRAEVLELDGYDLKGCIHGETLDEDKHTVRDVLKAVTYHNLAVHRRGDRLEASIVIDV